MIKHTSPLGLGVIEGYFGPPWCWGDRVRHAAFLKSCGFNFYIYAPKRCDDLRLKWTRDWPEQQWNKLVEAREAYGRAGIQFGVGLSPYALYRDLSVEGQKALQAKIERLDTLALDILGVFFDDMPGAGTDLAKRQADIMCWAVAQSRAKTFVICPTFYSDDPVLSRLSGSKPDRYLETLGEQLPAKVHIFWTGPRVCSREISAEHIQDVSRRLGRRPVLWDNYPVNDGARMSQFLHLRAFTGRGELPQVALSGHAINPMNQARLSEILIATLASLYRDPVAYEPEHAFNDAARSLCGDLLASALREDLEIFQDIGLSRLSPAHLDKLRERYSAFDSPYAREVVGWLDGQFAPTPEDLEEFATG